MTDPYEGLNATARSREQEEDLGEEEYDRLHREINDRQFEEWMANGGDATWQYTPNWEAIHREVVARMNAAKDAAQD